MTDPGPSAGARIRRWRHRLGLSQTDLALLVFDPDQNMATAQILVSQAELGRNRRALCQIRQAMVRHGRSWRHGLPESSQPESPQAELPAESPATARPSALIRLVTLRRASASLHSAGEPRLAGYLEHCAPGGAAQRRVIVGVSVHALLRGIEQVWDMFVTAGLLDLRVADRVFYRTQRVGAFCWSPKPSDQRSPRFPRSLTGPGHLRVGELTIKGQ